MLETRIVTALALAGGLAVTAMGCTKSETPSRSQDPVSIEQAVEQQTTVQAPTLLPPPDDPILRAAHDFVAGGDYDSALKLLESYRSENAQNVATSFTLRALSHLGKMQTLIGSVEWRVGSGGVYTGTGSRSDDQRERDVYTALSELHQRFVEAVVIAERLTGRELEAKWGVYAVLDGHTRSDVDFTTPEGAARALFLAAATGDVDIYRRIDTNLDRRIQDAQQRIDDERTLTEMWRRQGQRVSECENAIRDAEERLRVLQTAPWGPLGEWGNVIVLGRETRERADGTRVTKTLVYSVDQRQEGVVTLGEENGGWALLYSQEPRIIREARIGRMPSLQSDDEVRRAVQERLTRNAPSGGQRPTQDNHSSAGQQDTGGQQANQTLTNQAPDTTIDDVILSPMRYHANRNGADVYIRSEDGRERTVSVSEGDIVERVEFMRIGPTFLTVRTVGERGQRGDEVEVRYGQVVHPQTDQLTRTLGLEGIQRIEDRVYVLFRAEGRYIRVEEGDVARTAAGDVRVDDIVLETNSVRVTYEGREITFPDVRRVPGPPPAPPGVRPATAPTYGFVETRGLEEQVRIISINTANSESETAILVVNQGPSFVVREGEQPRRLNGAEVRDIRSDGSILFFYQGREIEIGYRPRTR